VPAGSIPLVLFHAYPLSSAMWAPLVAEMPDLPILEIDLPGAGFSPTIEPVTIEAAAGAAASVLRELGVRQAVIGGISMGGYVALALLRAHPELFAGLVLMNTKATADTPAARAGRLEVARRVLAEGSVGALRPMASQLVSAQSQANQPDLVGRLERWIGEATPAGVAWAQEAMASREETLGALRSFGVPAAVLAGEADPFVSLADAEAMADAIGPGTYFDVLSGVGHLCPLEVPNSVSPTIRQFYRRVLRLDLARGRAPA
jgi:pimeloyl-ACP methyl ester carboxylesterase